MVRLSSFSAVLLFVLPAGAQVAVGQDQTVGTALALSIEPAFHFVQVSDSSISGDLTSDGLGLGASGRAMLFPLARPDGALGFGVQGSATYAQLFSRSAGLVVGAGGLRYEIGQPRVAYWVDLNVGYGVASGVGNAPYFDIGIGWQFAATPSFMWGIVGRWGFFFPKEEVHVGDVTQELNYSLLSIGLALEWGPARWHEPEVTPIPMAQMGPQPAAQFQTAQPIPIQPGPQPFSPQPQPQPQPVQPQVIPIATPPPPQPQPQLQPAVGPPDQDSDGIGDEADACPTFPEDFNGRQDTDGCPDADRDADGVPDVIDQCPSRPEDFDGVRDEDGCPD